MVCPGFLWFPVRVWPQMNKWGNIRTRQISYEFLAHVIKHESIERISCTMQSPLLVLFPCGIMAILAYPFLHVAFCIRVKCYWLPPNDHRKGWVHVQIAVSLEEVFCTAMMRTTYQAWIIQSSSDSKLFEWLVHSDVPGMLWVNVYATWEEFNSLFR